MELRPGIVTPGWFDHREFAGTLPWPDLAGKRCLDVGTFEGFWAYEMERRGAGEVIGVDEIDPERWDWPAGAGDDVKAAIKERSREGEAFPRVCELLGSSVRREHCNVYDLDPARLGLFDFVYVGSVMLHLRDPIRALEAVRSVCRPDAVVVAADAIDVETSLIFRRRPLATLEGLGRPWWWKPNVAGVAQTYRSAGFTLDGPPRRVYLKPGPGQPTARPPWRLLRTPAGRDDLLMHLRGDPHVVVVARPNA
jgi:tRNA (mo5U34)-methyltransferase